MLRERARDLGVAGVSAVPSTLAEEADLVLYDVKSSRMEKGDLAQGLESVRRDIGEAPAVLLADVDDVKIAITAISRGWRGFIPTSLPTKVVLAAIRLVLAGGTFVPDGLIDYCAAKAIEGGIDLDPPVRTLSIPDESPAPWPIDIELKGSNAGNGVTHHLSSDPPDRSETGGLTIRESEVLDHLREGMQNKAIAFAMSISESTVKVHLRNIMRKLRATNRTQAVVMAQMPAQAQSSLDERRELQA